MAKTTKKKFLTLNINGAPTYYDDSKDTKYVGSGSITPSTFEKDSRKFFDFTIDKRSGGSPGGGGMTLTSTSTSPGTGGDVLSGIIYEENYKFDTKSGSEVFHFGINGNVIDTKVATLKANERIILGEPMIIMEPKQGGSTGSPAITLPSGGSGGTKQKKAPPKKAPSTSTNKQTSDGILQHTLEKYLIKEATDYLLSDKNIKSGVKTVLVDIFARDIATGYVKLDEKGKIEIHTVVLYRNPIDTFGLYPILVIDPNNFAYSSHLSNDNMKSVIDSSKGVIQTNPHQLQIYKRKGEAGSSDKDYRDCVDVAAKLAFGVHKEISINLDKIQALHAVQVLSNNTGINKSIPGALGDDPLRIQQDSDINIVKKFFTLSSKIRANLADIDARRSELEKEYITAVQKSNAKDKRGEALSDLYKLTKTTFLAATKDKEEVLKKEIEKLRVEYDSSLKELVVQEAELLGSFKEFFEA